MRLSDTNMTAMDTPDFGRELSFFERERMRLLNRANGKFALVKGEELIGIYDTEMDAVRAGYRQFGNEAFLIKHIVEADIPLNFTAFDLGS